MVESKETRLRPKIDEPATEILDIKQTIKVRGGHKGPITRLEKRLDTMVSQEVPHLGVPSVGFAR